MFAVSLGFLLVGLCMSMPLENGTEATTSQPSDAPPVPLEPVFCSGFKPGDSPGTYQLLSGNIYYNFSCQPPLIWSQEQCSCQAPEVEITDSRCPHHRPHPDDPRKYERRVHGVWLAAPWPCPDGQIWFQENCWCDFDPNAPPEPKTEAPPAKVDPVTVQTTARPTRTPVGSRNKPENFIVKKGVAISESVIPGENFTNPDYCDGFLPGSDPESYQVLSAGVYYNFTCQPPLVWSQERCSCQGRPVVIEDEKCPHHRPHPGDKTKYERRVHGVWLKRPKSCPTNQVWNQTNCWCDYGESKDPNSTLSKPVIQEQVTGPCFPIFNATFDRTIKDDSKFEFSVGREPWQAISMAPAVEGAHGGTARVQRGRMPLWFSGGNDFGGKLQIQIRFMVIEGSHKRDEDIVLMSNERCSGGPQTIAMYYRPDGEKYSVFFRDRNISRRIFCTSKSGNPYGFHHLDLVFFNELLTLTVDGVECFGSAAFKTGMMPSACFIGIGGSNFDGYIDDVVFRRGCLEEEEPA